MADKEQEQVTPPDEKDKDKEKKIKDKSESNKNLPKTKLQSVQHGESASQVSPTTPRRAKS